MVQQTRRGHNRLKRGMDGGEEEEENEGAGIGETKFLPKMENGLKAGVEIGVDSALGGKLEFRIKGG